MADEFVLKQAPVRAMQHDETIARAYEILAWVYRNNGTGSLINDELHVDPNSTIVPGNTWVVLVPGEGFKVMSDEDFWDTYKSA